MLVLTRKLMEKLFIGDDICVTVVRLEGGQVRLGIDAPRDVTVVRAELVPERAGAGPRPRVVTQHHPDPQAQPARPPVRTPPASAHGTGIRCPGRSR